LTLEKSDQTIEYTIEQDPGVGSVVERIKQKFVNCKFIIVKFSIDLCVNFIYQRSSERERKRERK
jgi:hypothetical protein